MGRGEIEWGRKREGVREQGKERGGGSERRGAVWE